MTVVLLLFRALASISTGTGRLVQYLGIEVSFKQSKIGGWKSLVAAGGNDFNNKARYCVYIETWCEKRFPFRSL